MDLKVKISDSLKDNFLSREESHEIFKILSTTYLSPKERVELIKYATRLAQEKADATNFSYVLKWLKKVNAVLGDFGSDEKHNNAYFSHEDDIRQEIIRTIDATKKTLDICLFTISDNPIADAIVRKKQENVKVRVITDDEKMMDKGSDIFRLKAKGIPVRIDESNSLMHHKFAIMDDQKLLSGSYNWTRTAAEVNNENIIITDNFRIVTSFRNEFERLWNQMEPL